MMDTDCPFCKIVAEREARAIAELGYLPRTTAGVIIDAKDPQAPVHKLAVLTKHSYTFGVIPIELFQLAYDYAEKHYVNEGYRLVVNVGRDSGSTISHPHIHILAGGPLGKIAGPITGG